MYGVTGRKGKAYCSDRVKWFRGQKVCGEHGQKDIQLATRRIVHL